MLSSGCRRRNGESLMTGIRTLLEKSRPETPRAPLLLPVYRRFQRIGSHRALQFAVDRQRPTVLLEAVSKRLLLLGGRGRGFASPRNPANCGVAPLHHSHPLPVLKLALGIARRNVLAVAGRLGNMTRTRYDPKGVPCTGSAVGVKTIRKSAG